jgi:Fe-S-cluster-containing dehydrogenase component/DMSO reductase anchor subunit
MADSTFIASLLAAQADLSAVERFTQRHSRATEPALARHYRDLLPLSAPRPGEQYAFAVDLDACTGCKACVTACHSLNGLDADESWRRIGTLVGDDADGGAVLQTVTMACHHCADPACLRGCPVGAYDKDAATGIVRHLDDQCIGCRYCVMMCPYDVPQYSPSRGIVRKCDMCHGRLAAGEAPACVQACPNEAIRIRVVPTDAGPSVQIADAPPPELTRPTTRYRSRRKTATRWRAIDGERATPADAHGPLVAMLVASQLAVGLFAAALLASARLPGERARDLAAVGVFVLLFGLAASLRHLGRPTKAWRAFLGLRTSWLSREIVAFGGLTVLAGAYVSSSWWSGPGTAVSTAIGAATVGVGLAGVACSAMVYHATGRGLWHVVSSGGQFFGTTLALGAAVLGLAASGTAPSLAAACAATVAAVTASKLAALLLLLAHTNGHGALPLARTARLLRGRLRTLTVCRVTIGTLSLGFAVAVAGGHPVAAVLVLGASLVGEVVERMLFFRAISPARMPGSL